MIKRNLCPSCKRSEHGGNRRNACVCKCHRYLEAREERGEKEPKANPKLDKFIEQKMKEWRELHKPVEKKE